MSRNKNVSYAKYVHEIECDDGKTRYAVGLWNQHDGQFTVPLDANTRKLTGCFAAFARKITGLPGPAYPTRAQALRRARYLYGNPIEEE
jgi:hypothetical protein